MNALVYVFSVMIKSNNLPSSERFQASKKLGSSNCKTQITYLKISKKDWACKIPLFVVLQKQFF